MYKQNLVLVGLPGSGKTTMGMKMAKLMNLEFVPEPYEKVWGELEDFYAEPSIEKRVIAQKAFVHAWHETMEGLDQNNSYVIDGGPYYSLNMYSKDLPLTPKMEIYNLAKQYFDFDKILETSTFIYVVVDPFMAMMRAINRARAGEKLTIDYLDILHENLLQMSKSTPNNIFVNNNYDNEH